MSQPQPTPRPTRDLSADVAELAALQQQAITVDADTYDALVAAVEAPATVRPRLAKLMAQPSPWS